MKLTRDLSAQVLALFVAVFASNGAWAGLVSADLDAGGDGLVTRDTASGLDWLDLPVTQNYSVNQILSGLNGRNFITEGWRYATIDEVHQLLGHVGLPIISGPLPVAQTVYYVNKSDTVLLAAITNLQVLLGNYYFSGYDWKSWGWAEPYTDAEWRASPEVSSIAINCCQNFFNDPLKAATIVFHKSDSIVNTGYNMDSHSAQFGSFLVRQTNTVPEPSMYTLLLVGVGLVGWVTRRDRRWIV